MESKGLRVFALLCLGGLTSCSSTGALGDGCTAGDASSCTEGLICAPDAEMNPVCSIAPGDICEIDRDPTGCRFGSVCTEVTEVVDGENVTRARCYISEGGTCDPAGADDFCQPELTCAELVDGTYQCHRPLLLVGRVLDSSDATGIADALVIGLDDQSIGVTDVAVSAADGAYSLEVPVVRGADGAPIEANFTLRGSADGYQTFPGGIRTALPISTTLAVSDARGWVIEDTITDVVLIPLADLSAPRVSIAGNVVAAGNVGGVLVVAEAGGVGYTALSDASGAYTIFNVPPATYEVRGYAADLQLTPVTADASVDLLDVDLLASEAALTTLSGSVNIVNAFGGAVTSVVLVVESTFSATFGRGEVPPGLRAPRSGPVSVSGNWSITGVPDGSYVVLAAFENDELVRDPDTNIAGTEFVRIDLPGATPEITLPESFKVTEALAVVGPGAERPEAVTSAPTLEWQDDSSEDFYSVVVYNAYGELVWEDMRVPSVSGADTVTVAYGGPLEGGMYYQFRATSWREPGGRMAAPISTTEDLLGVFYVDN